MYRPGFIPLILLAGLLLGCSSGPRRAPAIGEAYVGPATLSLRRDLAPRSPETASLRHGDRVEIIQRRRRFVKVRTSQGAEGWTDTGQLLSSAQMADLNRLAQYASRLPSQGAATVYGGLNAHTEPDRQAPSLYRIREGELVEVVEHRLVPRVPLETRSVAPEPPKAAANPRRKSSENGKISPPPLPPAPRLPQNWLELSQRALPPQPAPAREAMPSKPAPMDDWSLVRLPNGRAGWVLMGMLRMNIPDEVAQYSEGHRITSYFSLGQVPDGGAVKHNWLWTTISKGLQPHQFDSFRYFVWSLRHHRYETAYIEKNLKGYHPVELHSVRVTIGKRVETMPGFSLIVEEKDGLRYRRTYIYQTYVVRLASKTRWETPK